MDPALRAQIERRLAAFERRPLDPAGKRRAAVALTLVDDAQGRPCVVLTRRPDDLPRHPGQFALPGGRVDPGETPPQTARRELAEEVGLAVGPDTVLGALDDFVTRSGWLITPLVVWGGPDASLTPDPREVAAVYRVPLDDLLADDVAREEYIPESDRPVLSLGILGTRIYAPTAALLLQLREVGLAGRATRVAHYEQPLFAWR